MPNALRIQPSDNVAVALQDLQPSSSLSLVEDGHVVDVCTVEPIPFGHKVALFEIPAGADVIKYGARIGVALVDISPGQHVHVHNLASVRGAAVR